MPELSVIIPTLNERENVPLLVERLTEVLNGTSWEVVFVDDNSPDGTADVVRSIAQNNPGVRCLERVGRRGLSSACIEGMLATSSPYVAVMDADLQHDETLLPRMLETLKTEELDIAVGSRYASGGGVGNWDTRRMMISRFSVWLSHKLTRVKLADPMSGFFMLRRDLFHAALPSLSGMGFKILLDIFASVTATPRFRELPFIFRPRHAGESKLDAHVAIDFLLLLLDKLIGHVVPPRFIAFGLVGMLGIVVHMVILTALFRGYQFDFVGSQAAATLTAMTSNFFINNSLTYHDRRLRGWRLLWGWTTFTLACSLGAIANIGVASYLFHRGTGSWAVSALAGIAVGVVWNYAVTSIYTWGGLKGK